MDLIEAGFAADRLIAAEVAIQDRMWGPANERADATNNQLFDAALSQLVVTKCKIDGADSAEAVESAESFYPKGWEGLRDYGSEVANIVVAIAFLRSEVKRRVYAGEDTTRAKRGEPYVKSVPYVSSEEAATEARTVAHHSV